jgi:hypothetical protein
MVTKGILVTSIRAEFLKIAKREATLVGALQI